MKLRNDRRDIRISEGLERNEHWQSLSPAEQIKSLAGRRGTSKRQIAKLIPLLPVGK